ncbi:hypothetical protein [Flavobacterium quisquiliarum]|uniref:Uncharacterized protein n=1 Tax=Flavobacterium quisquiliarum TaxID=1834436 RepID=A0ABV8W3F3_9FLAO|nr:hypothetical protein [Flavobacterium quisquiliarum]MBW1655038.1 hypothetical protein [Flavobacterium quisquiliarum]NWL02629.1 hypothetical protein [Flavobacterium collinsii]
MTDQNKNDKKQKQKTKSIKEQFKITAINQTALSNIPYLYGMTLEEYEEGSAIHSKCFDQLKTIKAVAHN